MRKHFEKKKKISFLPRGEYRSRWDMEHNSKVTYNRKDKNSTKDYLEECENENNYCLSCGDLLEGELSCYCDRCVKDLIEK